MTRRPASLLRTLVRSLLFPVAVAGVVGVGIVYLLVSEEYDELQDQSLLRSANLLLTLLEETRDLPNRPDPANFFAFEKETLKPTDLSIFWFLDPAGKIIAASDGAAPELLPANLVPGLSTALDYRFAMLQSVDTETFVVVAVPMSERNEAISEVLIGVILGFLLLGMLSAAAAYWAVRRSAGMIVALSENISKKDAGNLTPIDRHNSFKEIDPAIDTVDKLMARLDRALSEERTFATNAAHELRTPVAVSLANVQRLKTQLKDQKLVGNATEIELGLKRLTRLIERLLQMSRARSGLGLGATTKDLAPVISLLLKELRSREPRRERLIIKPPIGEWPSRVDPDALGIILNNLFDNALKYRDGLGPMTVDASLRGRLIIANDCAPLHSEDIEEIKNRFVRKAGAFEGFGLGLSIVQELCSRSECAFEIVSPQPGSDRGFAAIVDLCLVQPATRHLVREI